MLGRRHFQQTDEFETRFAAEAIRLREEAKGTPPGYARDMLLRRARQAETGAHLSEWFSSPGLQPPK